jgi:16S rRNA (guanine966-N2)-methyltransferase
MLGFIMKPSSIRIVSGALKGRTIPSLPGRTVRPTSQRVREALFSILGERIKQATVGDWFAGTGAIGIEALSRGAARVAFIDHQGEHMEALHLTLTRLQILSQTMVLTAEIRLAMTNPNLLGWRPFDIVFLDPPYQFPGIAAVLSQIEAAQLMAPDGLIVYEHFFKSPAPAAVADWVQVRIARYGDTALSFYRSRGFLSSGINE